MMMNKSPKAKRLSLPPVKLPMGFDATRCSFQHDFVRIGWDEVSICESSLESYLGIRQGITGDLVTVLHEALGWIKKLRKGEVPFPNWDVYSYNVIGGLRFPTDGVWERASNSDDYLTVIRQDTTKNFKADSCSHYIRMDVHHAAVRMARVGAVSVSGLGDAPSLNEIRFARIELENQRIALDHEIERMAEMERAEKVRLAKIGKSQRKPRQRDGFVYLLQSPTGTYKIGHTSDPKDRRKTFDVKLPFEVEYLHLIPSNNMRALETELHERYAHCRVGGEFFALTPTDVSEICAMTGDAPTEGGN